MAAAKLLHRAGREVKVPTYLGPATQTVWGDVYTLPVPGCDGKTAAEIFLHFKSNMTNVIDHAVGTNSASFGIVNSSVDATVYRGLCRSNSSGSQQSGRN
jgi:hypothetical protein